MRNVLATITCASLLAGCAAGGFAQTAGGAVAPAPLTVVPTTTPSRRDGSVVVGSTWKGWRCLFPQHGPGRKHERSIALVPWQERLVARAPEWLLRGLIHTDGWRGSNRVTSKGKVYEYPRYQFSNRSDDIRRLFTDACDRLGVEWRQWTRYHVSVARRESVAYLDMFIGLKH